MYKLIAPRIKKVLYCLVALFIVLVARLIFVQFGTARPLSEMASDQYRTYFSLQPNRGIIYDRNHRELAISVNLDSIYADPFLVKEKELAAERLSAALNLDRDLILKKLNKNTRFVWLARKLQPEVKERVERLSIRGIGFLKEPKRVYPNGPTASHIIGFAGMDNKGLEGVELVCDRYLKGTLGWRYSIRDAKRGEVPGYEYQEIPPADGDNVVLTIDNVVQVFAEEELEDVCRRYRAKGGSIIVMDPYSGDIIALANRPTYDPNNTKGYPDDARRNRAISDIFEPGSVFKIVTAAAVLEEGIFSHEDEIFCENGKFKWYNHTYHDHRPYGWLSFKDVIKYSSNIGAMKAALSLGEEKFYNYIRRFGFGRKTGIGLPGEAAGMLRPLDDWSRLSICSIAMGQGIASTAIQLACAISAIANGGYYVRPRVISIVEDKTGAVVKRYEPKKARRVISRKAVRQLKEILRSVVDGGTGRRAEIKGYYPAGKTGTAQKVTEDGVYSHRRFRSTFAGFLPYDNPRFVIVVTVDESRPQYYGGTVCAPAFRKLAEEIMRYYKIPPVSS